MAGSSGSPMKDLLLFFALFAGMFVLWIVAGGPERASSGTTTSDGLFSIGSTAQIRSGGDGDAEPKSRREIEREIERTKRKLTEVQDEIEEARIRGEISPYEGRVSISSSNTRESIAQFEYIILRANSSNEEDINITGWKLESALTNSSAVIGKAAHLPLPGSVTNEGLLILAPGEKAVIVSGRSPIGMSFLINQCTGYFQQYQPYTPRLPERCPRPIDEFEDFGDIIVTSVRDDDYDQCTVYIRRNADRCEIVTTNLNARDTLGNFLIEPPLSNSCQTFIKNDLNYGTCVENHKNDFNFFKDEWRVFLGSYSELWRKESDIIRLLDAQSKTVDLLSYD